MSNNKYIRSTEHSLKFSNENKLEELGSFVFEYKRQIKSCLDWIWENEYIFEIEDKNTSKIKTLILDIKNDKLLSYIPYFDYKKFKPLKESSLSARAQSSLVEQLGSIILSSIKKRCKCLYIKEQLIKEGQSTEKIDQLLQNRYKLTKPNIENTNILIGSKLIDIQQNKNNKTFEYFLRFKCLGQNFRDIKVPLKITNRDKYFINNLSGKRNGAINLVFNKNKKVVWFSYTIENKNKNNSNIIVGCDQGLKDTLTFSDGKVTPKENKDGYNPEKIINIMCRKRKGSKAYKKCLTHLKNVTNWQINQLKNTISTYKQINLEKIYNIHYKKKSSRKLSIWSNNLIINKLKSVCEEQEVLVKEETSAYRSQRCYQCGLVRKSNRKGKIYKCKCGYQNDSDLNAALNHTIDLPYINSEFRKKRYNLSHGFYWKSNGLYSVSGEELGVPLSNKYKE